MLFWFYCLMIVAIGAGMLFALRNAVWGQVFLADMNRKELASETKGFVNFWLFKGLHDIYVIELQYYLHLFYVAAYVLFAAVAIPFGWLQAMQIPITVLGVLLSVTALPAVCVAGYYGGMAYTKRVEIRTRRIGNSTTFPVARIMVYLFLWTALPLFVWFLMTICIL